MASPTYLQLVNDVLIRLRENEVTAVTDNAYSKLIGKFVNDSKRQVEDAYNWNALCDSITVSTNAFIFNYSLLGSGQRFRIIDVLNDTNDNTLKLKTTADMNQYFLTGFEKGIPQYYNFNGVDSNGDTQVDVYPIPDTSYTLRFNIVKPTAPLSANSDTVSVPSEPVIFGAVARAIAERGEDGGIASNEQYALFKQSLGDAIALESGRYLEEDSWTAN
jgi:hypothetical protein